jgi:DNA modification methylase
MTKKITLTPDPRNANKGTQRGLGQLDNSLRKYGAGRSILADKHGVVIAGNKTLERAADLGLPVREVHTDGRELVVVVRDDLDLATDKTAKELAIADNRVAEIDLAWDGDVLAALKDEIDLSQFFDKDELAEILKDTAGNDAADPGADTNRADELREKWQTELGQLWQVGRHRLLVGDCTVRENVARLMGGERAACGFFDPPYGIEYQSNARTASPKFDVLQGDRGIDGAWIPLAVEYLADAGALYICTRWDVYPEWRQLVEQHIRLKNVVVWDKVDWSRGDLEGDYSPRHEFILYCVNGRHKLRGHRESNVWSFGAMNKQDYLHPTQKKLELPEFAIQKSSDVGDVVIDWFVGSGTTLVACERLGRVGRGCELSPAYAAVTLERLCGLGLDAHKVE